MVVRYEHPDFSQVSSVRWEWALASDAARVVIFSRTVPAGWSGPLLTTPPAMQKYEQSGGFEKPPAPNTGPYVLRHVSVNVAGETPSAWSDPFIASAPPAAQNLQVIDPHL
jgi:hypothetical protein